MVNKMVNKKKLTAAIIIMLSCSSHAVANVLDPSSTRVSDAPSSDDIAQERIDKSKEMFKDIEAAALNSYVNAGTWSSSLDVMAASGKYLGNVVGPYGKNFKFIPQADGSSLIEMQTQTAAQAKQLANLVGSGVAVGNTVTKRIGTPAEGALRNSLLSDYVDIDTTSRLKFQVDIDLNGNNVNNIDAVYTNKLNIGSGGVDFGSTSIKEMSPGQLAFNATNTRFSKDLDVGGMLSAKDMTVANKVTSTAGEFTNMFAVNAELTNLESQEATIKTADIENLSANAANFQQAVAQTLEVSGLTTLADLVANQATFTGLVKSGSLQISGAAVVSSLEAQGVTVSNAVISKAEVTSLVSALANITNVYADLVDSNKVVANYGQINDLYGTNANIKTLVSDVITAQTFDVGVLKALSSELDSATANTLNVLGSASIKSLTADTGTIKTLVSDVATIKDLKSTTLTNSGKLTTGTLQVNSDATINGNMTVAKTLTSKNVNVSNSATIAGTATTNTLKVNSNADVLGTTSTTNLNVANSATAKNLTAATLNASSANVTNALSTKTLVVSDSMNVAGGLTTNNLTSGSATINGKLVTQQLEAQLGQINTLTTSNATVTNQFTTRDLVVTSLATLNAANINNLVASISNIGTASGSSLALTGNLNAKSATLQTLNVSGKATFGALESAGNGVVNGDMTVGRTLTATNTNITGTLTANNANLGVTTASSVTASGTIQGSDIRNSAGVSLNALKAGFDGHGGRIGTMERWIADCKAKAVAECNR
tara:strand:+ start:33515 stop:35833 length:2319 start_codon:yes stop_codon:yes gene_type:complete